MNALSTKALAVIFILTLGVGMGWQLKGWKVVHDAAKALEAQVKEFNAKVEVKHENVKTVYSDSADLDRVRVRLQACKTDLNTSTQAVARAGEFYAERQRELDIVTGRIKADALTCDLFIEDLRSR